MKLIIDIPEYVIDDMKECGFIPEEDNEELCKAIDNGTPIPDNITNGDVIKAMFPNGTTAKFCTFLRFIDGEHYFDCSEDWWNAPYQKGGK